MPRPPTTLPPPSRLVDLVIVVLAVLALGLAFGCGRERPAIEARAQTITFAAPPTPGLNQGTATVSATASSGLPVRYTSTTAALCQVDANSGVLTAQASGACTIAASQAGDTRFAPAPQVTQTVTFAFADTLTFSPAPTLAVHDLATVHAVASTGASVGYASSTPATCAVEDRSGLLSAVSVGDCTIVATADGLTATLTLTITAPAVDSVPGPPSQVTASAGDAAGTVVVRVGEVAAGGHSITSFRVTSSPLGAVGRASTQPVTVTCPGSCLGYVFTVAAGNERGEGLPSEPAEVITRYGVTATFHEPDTQPNDSIFIGGYVLNGTTGVVCGLQGRLSESMTGGATPYPADSMTWLGLEHQLSSMPSIIDGEEVLLVTTFRLDSVETLSADLKFGGTDGWSPGTGTGLYFGYPGVNPANAYAQVVVRPADPTSPLTIAQVAALAYADCTPGGMMGASCMTGTDESRYGTTGTMGGHPVSQVTRKE